MAPTNHPALRSNALGIATVLLAGACALGSAGCVAPASDEAAAYEESLADPGGKADGAGSGDTVVFRISAVAVREPHFFVRPVFSCTDLTDRGVMGEPSINRMLNDFITGDDPSDPNGILDLSLMMLFRPLDTRAASGRMDFGAGNCSTPASSTECDLDPAAYPTRAQVVNRSDGYCMVPDANDLSSAEYSPRPTAVAGPCFTTAPFDTTLRLGLVDLPVRDATVAGTYRSGGIGWGSLRGFVTEGDADSVLLPDSLPIVGGKPISVMFPGGDGNCARHDDRDVHEGRVGWWIYAEFNAEEVKYVGP
ncbi:MAG: hypothetical protein JRI23_03570 [Deltaproteobacteria bacterium]|jgi:hypothetical protein|nr:hypothetical protein [Deltaproteobacteria bacterium]MBW2530595.1 hypothetical protein [Deltaproteobacteria bacterium]